MATTPNMSLLLPTPSLTIGPDWAQELVNALTTVDGHNHTASQGAPVPTSALLINADVPFNGYNAAGLRSSRYSDQASALGGPNDIDCISSVAGNLYWNNGSGFPVQITSGSGLNAASIGGIGGDYATSTASAYYTSASQTFTFTAAANVAAALDGGPLTIRDTAASALGITLKTVTGLVAAYVMTLPSALPASQSLVSLDQTGAMATVPITNASIQVGGASYGFVPVGVVLPYAGASAPPGFLLCNGAAISRTTYAALFAAIGTVWGPGDGSTTFNVPGLGARSIMGAGSGPGLTTRTLGSYLGEENHALSLGELASHNHGGATGNESATHSHTDSGHGHGTHSHTDSGHLHAASSGQFMTNVSTAGVQTGTGLNVASAAFLNTASAAANISSVSVPNGSANLGTESATHTHSISSAGSGTGHNTVHPVAVLNHIIKF